MHGRLAKIQEKARKWNRSVRLEEAARNVEALAGEVIGMNDEEMAEASERVAALRKEIQVFERKVAERKALDKNDDIDATGKTSAVFVNDFPPKDKNAAGAEDILDKTSGAKEDEGDKAVEEGAGKGKKRKRGAN